MLDSIDFGRNDLRVLLVYHLLGEAIGKRVESLTVSLDITKAFNRVWHKDLLSKLGIRSARPVFLLPRYGKYWISGFLRFILHP